MQTSSVSEGAFSIRLSVPVICVATSFSDSLVTTNSAVQPRSLTLSPVFLGKIWKEKRSWFSQDSAVSLSSSLGFICFPFRGPSERVRETMNLEVLASSQMLLIYLQKYCYWNGWSTSFVEHKWTFKVFARKVAGHVTCNTRLLVSKSEYHN